MFSSNQVFRKTGVPGNQVFAVKIVLILVGNIRRKRVFCTKIKNHGRPPDPLELEFLDSIFNTLLKGKKEKEGGKKNLTIHNQVFSSNQVGLAKINIQCNSIQYNVVQTNVMSTNK